MENEIKENLAKAINESVPGVKGWSRQSKHFLALFEIWTTTTDGLPARSIWLVKNKRTLCVFCDYKCEEFFYAREGTIIEFSTFKRVCGDKAIFKGYFPENSFVPHTLQQFKTECFVITFINQKTARRDFEVYDNNWMETLYFKGSIDSDLKKGTAAQIIIKLLDERYFDVMGIQFHFAPPQYDEGDK